MTMDACVLVCRYMAVIKNLLDSFNLVICYTPSTVDVCFAHNGSGLVGGIKEEIIMPNGRPYSIWNTQGHKDRIIQVTEKELVLFAQLYDEEGTEPLAARLPALHAQQLLAVLEKFAAQPQRLGDLKGQYTSTSHVGMKPMRKMMAPFAAKPAFPPMPASGCFWATFFCW